MYRIVTTDGYGDLCSYHGMDESIRDLLDTAEILPYKVALDIRNELNSIYMYLGYRWELQEVEV